MSRTSKLIGQCDQTTPFLPFVISFFCEPASYRDGVTVKRKIDFCIRQTGSINRPARMSAGCAGRPSFSHGSHISLARVSRAKRYKSTLPLTSLARMWSMFSGRRVISQRTTAQSFIGVELFKQIYSTPLMAWIIPAASAESVWNFLNKFWRPRPTTNWESK